MLKNAVSNSLGVSNTALRSIRKWMNSISNNIANKDAVDTGKRDKYGNLIPYARQVPVFETVLSEKWRKNKVRGDVKGGVTVKEIISLKNNYRKVYDPSHPAARAAGSPDAGHVFYPEIHIGQEMADMKVAELSYNANVAVIETTKGMMKKAFEISK